MFRSQMIALLILSSILNFTISADDSCGTCIQMNDLAFRLSKKSSIKEKMSQMRNGSVLLNSFNKKDLCPLRVDSISCIVNLQSEMILSDPIGDSVEMVRSIYDAHKKQFDTEIAKIKDKEKRDALIYKYKNKMEDYGEDI